MSNVQYAFLMRSEVPTKEALQATIDALGFDLQLDPLFTPFTDSGFSPCVLNGVAKVGFEVLYESATKFDGFDDIIGSKDFCISMGWQRSMQDCATAMIVSCALAKDFGAVISYEGEPPVPVESLVAQTWDIVKNIEKDNLKSQSTPTGNKPTMKPWWKIW